MKTRNIALIIGVVGSLLLASCVTVDELEPNSLRGERMTAYLMLPPQPEVSVSYDLTFDPDNPVKTVVSIGTNLAKSSAAAAAEDRMRSALASVDVPARILELSYAQCADSLGAIRVYHSKDTKAAQAPYAFVLDIRSYGIDAASHSGNVRFHVSLVASIRGPDELIWRRSISTDESVHPAVFGLPDEVGSVLTVGVLASLSEDEMRAGFERLIDETARNIARKLDRDLYRS